MRRQFDQKKIPKQLAESLLKFIEFKNGEKLSRVSPKEIIGRVKIPILMLHGKDDKSVVIEDFKILKSQLNHDSKAVVLESVDHLSILNNKNVNSEILSFIEKQFETEFIFNPSFLRKVD